MEETKKYEETTEPVKVLRPWWKNGIEAMAKVRPSAHNNWVEMWADQVFLNIALEEHRTMYRQAFEGVAEKKAAAEMIAWATERAREIMVFQAASPDPGSIMVSDDAYIYINYNPSNRDFTLVLITCNEHLMQEFIAFKKDRLKKKSEYAGEVYMLGEVGDQLKLFHVGHGGVPFERDNYAPDVVESYDKMKRELGAIVPRGRLALIDGPPGTGKTFFVRGLIEEVSNAVFIYIPAALVPQLDKPSFIPALLEVANENPGPKVLVIEDADMLLVQRQSDNITSISTLLNVTDGTFGDLIDFRVIATTNARRIDIDKAMARKGRVMEKITIDKIDASHANKILDKLVDRHDSSTNFTQPVLLGDVYDKAIELGWEAPPCNPESYHTINHRIVSPNAW